MRRVLMLFMTIVLAFTSLAFAQGEQTGTLHGRLSSSDGLALPGGVVTVSSPSLQGTRSATADVNGIYSLPGLPAGDYTVHFDRQGFAAVDRRVTVPLGSPVVVDQVLGPQPVRETVDVRGTVTAPADV